MIRNQHHYLWEFRRMFLVLLSKEGKRCPLCRRCSSNHPCLGLHPKAILPNSAFAKNHRIESNKGQERCHKIYRCSHLQATIYPQFVLPKVHFRNLPKEDTKKPRAKIFYCLPYSSQGKEDMGTSRNFLNSKPETPI